MEEGVELSNRWFWAAKRPKTTEKQDSPSPCSGAEDERASAACALAQGRRVAGKNGSTAYAAPRQESGPLVIMGCAPNDWHELELLLLYLMLRRRGHDVLYLCQNDPVEQFTTEMRHLRLALVIVSAATMETVQGLVALTHDVQRLDMPRPIFGFGGGIFNRHPELRAAVPGIFLGENARVGAETVAMLLAASQLPVDEAEAGASPRVMSMLTFG